MHSLQLSYRTNSTQWQTVLLFPRIMTQNMICHLSWLLKRVRFFIIIFFCSFDYSFSHYVWHLNGSQTESKKKTETRKSIPLPVPIRIQQTSWQLSTYDDDNNSNSTQKEKKLNLLVNNNNNNKTQGDRDTETER